MSWPGGKMIVFGILGLMAVIALITLGSRLLKNEQDENSNLVNSGVVWERAKTQEKVIVDIEDARRPVTANELNSVCSRYDRNCAGQNSQ